MKKFYHILLSIYYTTTFISILLCTFTFSGKKMLHLQENVALARKCCICKKMLQLQENHAFSGKKMLHLQEIFLQMQENRKKILHLQENFLQIQHFLAIKSKIFLQLQHFLADATFSCQCNIFLQMQHFLATKCKGALLEIHRLNAQREYLFSDQDKFGESFRNEW